MIFINAVVSGQWLVIAHTEKRPQGLKAHMNCACQWPAEAVPFH